MSSDKRRRARIQGGWAAPAKPKDVRSDADKPKIPQCPAWYGKNTDAAKLQKFVFEDPAETERKKPDTKIIDKSGVYDLSISDDGYSRIRLFYNFIDPKECDWMYDQLFHELPWRQRYNVFKGNSYQQPRLTAWFGEHPYSYSGQTLEPNTNWTPLLITLKDRIEEVTGFVFNSLLANLYRDGHDSMDWHADDEPSLGKCPTIASLSFGDPRNFELRKNPPPEDKGEYTYMEHIKVPLTKGTLLIMEGKTQEEWQHRVPKEYHDRDARINLTFRMTLPL